jgi:hypothetical protein
MNTVELSLVIVAAVGLAIWRGVAMYHQTFPRKTRRTPGTPFLG